ncbi:hypothetical protein N6H14_32190 [Paenibacillus sp. CC-CFT747]|nr:hypothetical protein N6H14_32190 [Paenibacillus sp. CC-CFT747]
MKLARIGILLDRQAASRLHGLGQNVFQAYLGEILAHAGIGFRWLDSADELNRDSFDLVLVALAGEDKATAEALLRFAEQGEASYPTED